MQLCTMKNYHWGQPELDNLKQDPETLTVVFSFILYSLIFCYYLQSYFITNHIRNVEM